MSTKFSDSEGDLFPSSYLPCPIGSPGVARGASAVILYYWLEREVIDLAVFVSGCLAQLAVTHPGCTVMGFNMTPTLYYYTPISGLLFIREATLSVTINQPHSPAGQ